MHYIKPILFCFASEAGKPRADAVEDKDNFEFGILGFRIFILGFNMIALDKIERNIRTAPKIRN